MFVFYYVCVPAAHRSQEKSGSDGEILSVCKKDPSLPNGTDSRPPSLSEEEENLAVLRR